MTRRSSTGSSLPRCAARAPDVTRAGFSRGCCIAVGHHVLTLPRCLASATATSFRTSWSWMKVTPPPCTAPVSHSMRPALRYVRISRSYPEVRCNVQLTNRRVDLVAEGFDLAIRAAPERMKNSSLTSRRLGGASAKFYAAPAYVTRRGKPNRLGEPKHDWILHTAMLQHWKLPRDLRWRFLCDDFFLIRDRARRCRRRSPAVLLGRALRGRWADRRSAACR